MLNVKKTNSLSIAFILLLCFYFSCETTQKQSLQNDILKIDYYVRYLQSDKQVKAEISFSEIVDSTKKIVPKRMEEVLFQNSALDGKKVKDTYKYQLAKQSPFVDTYNFAFRDYTQQVANQPVSINPIADFSIKKNKVSKLGGTTISLEGKPLQEEESIIILLSDANNKTITFFAKALAINISPEKISGLTLGQGTIYAVRKQNLNETSAASYQLKGLTEYYSEVKEIEIVE